MKLNSLIENINKLETINTIEKGLSSSKPFKISGLNTGAKTLLVISLIKKSDKNFFILCSSKEEEEIVFSILNFFDISYQYLPSLERSPYECIQTDLEIISEQFKTIDNIINNNAKCIISSTKILNHKFIEPNDLLKNIIRIKVGVVIPPLELTQELIRLGYKATESIENEGNFSRKGGILVIYPVGYETAVKIEWFDDEIETIRDFDIFNKRTKNNRSIIDIYPTSRLPIPKKINQNFDEQLIKTLMTQVASVYASGKVKNAEELRKNVEKQVENIKSFNYDDHTYLYLDLLYKNTCSILDYLSDNTILIWYEFNKQTLTTRKFEEDIKKDYKEKCNSGEILALENQLFIEFSEILKKSRKLPQIRMTTLNESNKVDLSFSGSSLPIISEKFDEMANTLKKFSDVENKKIVILTLQPQRAITILRERDCNVVYGEEIEFNKLEKGIIYVIKGEIKSGFVFPDLNIMFLTDAEIFGWKQKHLKSAKKKINKNAGMKIKKVQDIKEGDYVVHEVHGVGKYKGLDSVEINGEKKDYFEIVYANSDTLLVPIEKLNLLSLYRGAKGTAPKLSKMGGLEWKKAKSRVKASLKDIAAELIELYAKRSKQKGYAFPPDTQWQREMELAFPYEETADQLKAILETKTDMEKDKPMDRLICGDVGFGKTEVAIRAIFKAVMSSKQVAIVAPTTVLSQQLYDILHERFSPYPIKMAIVNRFRTKKESEKIYQEIKKGNLDIIVSTHKILIKTPEFYDLGLVVIDEEHKFGVQHKEKLKQFKANIDVIAMSATPIPRTLYMSLSGARTLSLIETAPRNRFPVKTTLQAFKRDKIKSAILLELNRGGQVYFVHNRVESLNQVFEELKDMLPDIKIGIGHGQLPEHELENVMLAFNNNELDLLLCTTIIESGIDIPNANTMIIDNVHRLGLAQIYQLKGRVGRSDKQAYAHFVYPENYNLTDEARQRLQVIQDMTDLGSGYQVALRDMEIRGIGDLLGAGQHGNVITLGYDTFCQILEETINELKPKEEKTYNYLPTVVVDLNATCHIPDDWIKDYKVKIQTYRRLSTIQDLDLLEEIQKELSEDFGEIPNAANNLLKIARIRIIASKLGITYVTSLKKKIKLNYEISEKKWHEITEEETDLLRWRWSLTELSTPANTSPDNSINIILKMLTILFDHKDIKKLDFQTITN